MLCNKRPGSSAPCFVRSSFGDEALILVIKRSFGTSEMDSFLFKQGYFNTIEGRIDIWGNCYLNVIFRECRCKIC